MKPSLFRELARRYAAGELSLEEYRAQRRKLINNITSGAQKLEHAEPFSIHGKQFRLVVFLGIAILIAASGIGIFLWVEHAHEFNHSNYSASAMPISGPVLVQTFIETNDWSDISIVQFLKRWNGLSSHEQNAAYHSYLFPRLLSQLHEQIASQQAVVDLATGDTNKTEQASIHLVHLQQLNVTLSKTPADK